MGFVPVRCRYKMLAKQNRLFCGLGVLADRAACLQAGQSKNISQAPPCVIIRPLTWPRACALARDGRHVPPFGGAARAHRRGGGGQVRRTQGLHHARAAARSPPRLEVWRRGPAERLAAHAAPLWHREGARPLRPARRRLALPWRRRRFVARASGRRGIAARADAAKQAGTRGRGGGAGRARRRCVAAGPWLHPPHHRWPRRGAWPGLGIE